MHQVPVNNPYVELFPALPHETMLRLEAESPSLEKRVLDGLSKEARAKIAARLEKHTIYNPVTGCYECTYKDVVSNGYRRICITDADGVKRKFCVIRVNMVLHGIPLPDRLEDEPFEVDHWYCQVPKCHNTSHLEVVMRKINRARYVGGIGDEYKCCNGHQRNAENTYTDSEGTVRCRICQSAASARCRARRRAKKAQEKQNNDCS